MFLEKRFAYTIYDYIQEKREEGKLDEIQELEQLNLIAKEAFSLNRRHYTRQLLERLCKENNTQFMKQIHGYLARFHNTNIRPHLTNI
tara:strand:- start:229 stop:492 length:264 start_codon:yes stop_codon:yes gene_type:complete